MMSFGTQKDIGVQHLEKERVWSPVMEYTQVGMRLICLVGSTAALACMVTARQSGSVSFYGFMLPLHSKWSFSQSFRYLLGTSAVVIAHSFCMLILSSSRAFRKSSVIPSRTYAWFTFAADQVLAYAMIGAGAAASGVTNLNRTGVEHTALPNFCKPLDNFCNHIALSIAFAFLTGFLLAASAAQEVIWLSYSAV